MTHDHDVSYRTPQKIESFLSLFSCVVQCCSPLYAMWTADHDLRHGL